MEKGLSREFTKGILVENPVLRLVLGTCPTLAVTTSAMNGLGMGLSALVVLVCSNVVISLLRNVIPDRVRIPAFITVIATFVTVIQMFIKAFFPTINDALGIYLPLIVVNCIILGRAEMFASKNKVLPSLLDGLGMGVGFTAALLAMGCIRELLGVGTIFGFAVTKGHIEPMLIMIMAPGGFFVFGVLIALANKLAVAVGKEPAASLGCAGCPNAEACAHCELPASSLPAVSEAEMSVTEQAGADAADVEKAAESANVPEQPAGTKKTADGNQPDTGTGGKSENGKEGDGE